MTIGNITCNQKRYIKETLLILQVYPALTEH